MLLKVMLVYSPVASLLILLIFMAMSVDDLSVKLSTGLTDLSPSPT